MNSATRQEIGKGYAFAYFAWMRMASPGTYRGQAGNRATFFHLFASLNGRHRPW